MLSLPSLIGFSDFCSSFQPSFFRQPTPPPSNLSNPPGWKVSALYLEPFKQLGNTPLSSQELSITLQGTTFPLGFLLENTPNKQLKMPIVNGLPTHRLPNGDVVTINGKLQRFEL